MKQEPRTQFKTWRSSRDPAWIHQQSARISAHALGLPIVNQAQRVGIYLSTGREVETDTILQALQRRGAAVAVPFFRPDGYELSWLEDRGELTLGPFGIREPVEPHLADPADLDLIFVPGLAFDDDGYRLGYGGGHFDRLLSRTEAVRIGLCFDGQRTHTLPREPHDMPMHLLITESGVREITGDTAAHPRPEGDPS
ncbi:MAG: 5-formyltetrahydrofolate cyclo-ligase [Verrucomicrobia bacterium]|nr:5-formyltetrahydrofolate cyclo-ligase [Verrucomicrobiota bacterium]